MVDLNCDSCSVTTCEQGDIHEFIWGACTKFGGCTDYKLIDDEIKGAMSRSLIEVEALRRFKKDWSPLSGYLGDFACEVYIHAATVLGEVEQRRTSAEKLGADTRDTSKKASNSRLSISVQLQLPSREVLKEFFKDTLFEAVKKVLMVQHQQSTNGRMWLRYVLFTKYCDGVSAAQLAVDYILPDEKWVKQQLNYVTGRLREAKLDELIDSKRDVSAHIQTFGKLPDVPDGIAREFVGGFEVDYSEVIRMLLSVANSTLSATAPELQGGGKYGREVFILKGVIGMLELQGALCSPRAIVRKMSVQTLADATLSLKNALPDNFYLTVFVEVGRYEFVLYMRERELKYMSVAKKSVKMTYRERDINKKIKRKPLTASAFRSRWLMGVLK